MKLEEAIELQETVLEFTEDDEPKGIIQATKLSIEALEFRQRWEEQEGEDDFPLLPSEDPE